MIARLPGRRAPIARGRSPEPSERPSLSRYRLRVGISVAFGQNVETQTPFDAAKKAALTATCARLSLAIAVLAGLASLAGLFPVGLYRDNAFVVAGWHGNDLVTLVVGVPLLVATRHYAGRGSERARLAWLGSLHYALYNYAFYLFGAALNKFFLVYVALFTLAIFALVAGLAGTDAESIAKRFEASTPVKRIAGYMLFVGVGLGGLWIVESLRFAATGRIPEVMVATGHAKGDASNLVAALDLSLLSPALLLGAFWLWRRRPWGYVLGVMLNVSGALYTLVLTAASLAAASAGIPGAAALLPLWVFLSVGCATVSAILLMDLRPALASHLP
jgi:hypothetical protein